MGCEPFLISQKFSPVFIKLWKIPSILAMVRSSWLTLPNIGGGGGTMHLPNRRSLITSRCKLFWWQIFFTFHIYIFDTFWPNFMALSFQLLKLWPFLEGWCSQNEDFTVQTLYKWQILEIAVKCELFKIYTWNFVRILVFIRVLRL